MVDVAPQSSDYYRRQIVGFVVVLAANVVGTLVVLSDGPRWMLWIDVLVFVALGFALYQARRDQMAARHLEQLQAHSDAQE